MRSTILVLKSTLYALAEKPEKAAKESEIGKLKQEILQVLMELRKAPFYLNFLEAVKQS